MPRADILGYCAEHGLQPRYDRSNEDATFYRNRLRHELLPLLESYNPQIRRILASTAAVLADDYELLQDDLTGRVAAGCAARRIWPAGRWTWRPGALCPQPCSAACCATAIHRLRASLRNISYVHVDSALWLLREGHGRRPRDPTRWAGDRARLQQICHRRRGRRALPLSNLPQMDDEWLPLPVPGTISLPGWQIDDRAG